ncbi:MAG TPA: hypothetical protein PKC72_13985 [Chitinophagaceae bacterium]|nr:hypothetical protein [Chitinophagaceae bacterium]
MNWPGLILVGLGGTAFIAFLVIINIRDAKKFGKNVMHDYRKPRKKKDADTNEENG